MKNLIRVFVLCLCICALSVSVFASDGQVMTQDEYCYQEEDFTREDTELCGIFVTQVPERSVASIMLGNRIICPGDMLTVQNLNQLRLQPCCSQNCDAVLGYQPVFGNKLGENTFFKVRIQSGKNEPPKAVRQEFETYKNIANDGKLSGTDPENAPLTFQLVEAPKRGKVKLEPDGTYLYTPDKNKVGEDSFTFTVTDEAGNVSAPATVNIRILKPNDAMTYADMEGSPDCFESMWLRETGLLVGRTVAGTPCFYPDETVSRSEFLIMAMKLKNTPVDGKLTISGFSDAAAAPAWVQPYLAAAMKQGYISGEVCEEGLLFRPNDPITQQEAAVLLQNMLKLPVETAEMDKDCHWAAGAVRALNAAGVHAQLAETPMARMDAAKLLWQISRLFQ